VLAGIRYDFPPRGLADKVASPEEVLAVPAQLQEVLPLALQLEEIRREQAANPWCRIRLSSRDADSLFDINDAGILVRKAPVDGVEQIVVRFPFPSAPVFSTWSTYLESPDTRASLECSVPYDDIISGNTRRVTLPTRSWIAPYVRIIVSNESGRVF
jgi:hypothetical protein